MVATSLMFMVMLGALLVVGVILMAVLMKR